MSSTEGGLLPLQFHQRKLARSTSLSLKGRAKSCHNYVMTFLGKMTPDAGIESWDFAEF